MQEYIQIISNVGFPIFVSLYLLIIIGPVMNKLSNSIETLTSFLKIFMDNK